MLVSGSVEFVIFAGPELVVLKATSFWRAVEGCDFFHHFLHLSEFFHHFLHLSIDSNNNLFDHPTNLGMEPTFFEANTNQFTKASTEPSLPPFYTMFRTPAMIRGCDDGW